ncbi:type IV pilus secretin PilQ [Wenzhouxiangella marina]|nr:type IV pilus secretin PilQ [Wenzhouxiangella marina]MBB6087477.1 type IV pilus assembly protein PilQ [Wenzhouxiangella marina]
MAMLVFGLFWAASAAQATEVTDVRVESGDGEVRFVLSTDEAPPNPTVFLTEQPPRIVLEMPDTTTRIAAERVPVGVGPAQSYMALSAGGRTRLVVDLSRSTPYEVEVSGNSVALVLGAGAGVPTSSSTRSAAAEGFEVTGIDFRRGDNGESRILVDLNRPGVTMTVNERANGLRVDLFGTRLPDDLYQRLDVADFATPVQFITPEQRGQNVRLSMDVNGAYQHMAYQTGDRLVIEVGRPVEEAEAQQELQFFEEREYEGSRITLNFQDIQVRSVLQLIADVSNLNIVVSDSVTGSLTLRLTNVPWDQALDIVLETKNLDMRRSGNVIWIAPTNEIAQREQQILQARADRQTLEPLRTAMISVSYANAEDLANLIRSASAEEEQGLLSERGSVTVDQRTNTLLISDMLERIDEIRALVAELDRPVRQVLIESRIVIARHDFNYELGVRFGVSSALEDGRGNVFSTSGSSTALDQMNNLALINRRAGTGSSLPVTVPGSPGSGIVTPSLNDRLNVNLPVTNPAGRLGFSILAADYLLDLELSALESEGNGEVVSTPRVITANQAEAFIKQGVEIPYEEATSSGASSVQFQEAVLELRVTPLITPDNRVQLNLGVKQDTVGEIFQTGRGGTVPSIDTRELQTRVLVDNGQTVVLGGIFQEERNFTSSKVPVLGDVPVLGHLFRRRGNDEQKRELLIFVTPSILDDRVDID